MDVIAQLSQLTVYDWIVEATRTIQRKFSNHLLSLLVLQLDFPQVVSPASTSFPSPRYKHCTGSMTPKIAPHWLAGFSHVQVLPGRHRKAEPGTKKVYTKNAILK